MSFPFSHFRYLGGLWLIPAHTPIAQPDMHMLNHILHCTHSLQLHSVFGKCKRLITSADLCLMTVRMLWRSLHATGEKRFESESLIEMAEGISISQLSIYSSSEKNIIYNIDADIYSIASQIRLPVTLLRHAYFIGIILIHLLLIYVWWFK